MRTPSSTLRRLCLLAPLALAAICRADTAPVVPSPPLETLPVQIAPNDPNLYYIGRADNRDPAGPRFEWSHSMVEVAFKGSSLQAEIDESGDDYFNVVVDNGAPAILHPPKGDSVVDLAYGLPDGDHVVSFIKRTEAFAGAVQFRHFYLDAGGKLEKPNRLSHKLEVIGDSISCGFGNEAHENDPFTTATENAALAYGAIAADTVGAEYVCTAWSGRTMWPTNTIPAIYDLALPTDKTSNWDFRKWKPDAVLINLGTNDFRQGNPDETGWTTAYEKFVHHVRAHYPNAVIYIASGTMMTDDFPVGAKSLTTLNRYLDKIHADLYAAGDNNIHIIHFGIQDRVADGMGAFTHPSMRTHEKMAATWVAALDSDLGWTQ